MAEVSERQPGGFQCKFEKCPYSRGSARFFRKHQYLKQHYDKVHAEKIHSCQLCFKKFSTITLLKSHTSSCGKEFKCSCGVVYSSNEALLTHARRKNHTLATTKRTQKGKMQSVLVNIPKGSQLIILHPGTQMRVYKDLSQSNCQSSMHVMAAVALSELASGMESNKRDSFTQTDPISTDQSSGTQTEYLVGHMSSPESPASPWLGLSAAETQTVDEDIVLRPFNLCNIQTQTLPWNELMSDEEGEESIEFAHTETQTLLSSFFEDSLPECQMEQKKLLLAKLSSEDAGTDPMI